MSLGGGGGEIPKGARAGRARSLGIWPRGREIPRDLAPGGRVHGGGGNPWDTGIYDVNISLKIRLYSVAPPLRDGCSQLLQPKDEFWVC